MTAIIEAEPYPFDLVAAHAGLVIIDMQRDFVEPGGFGDALGNDVSLLRRTIAPTRRLLDAARMPGLTVIHTREGHRPDLADLPPAKKARGRLASRHRRPRPDGPHPGARRTRPRHHRRAVPVARRAGRRQAGQGRLLRDRPRRDPEEPRHHPADRLRRHHRGLRQHHGARGQRPRLRLPRPRRLRRLLLPGVPGDRAAHDQGARRHLRLGRVIRRGHRAHSRQPVR